MFDALPKRRKDRLNLEYRLCWYLVAMATFIP